MGAGIMVICKDKVLVLKRANYKNDPYANYWDFPGGQGRLEESSYETAVREVREEIGISVPYIKIVEDVKAKYYTMYIGVVPNQFKPELSEEHISYKWVSMLSISRIKNLHPKDKNGLKVYLSRKNIHHT